LLSGRTADPASLERREPDANQYVEIVREGGVPSLVLLFAALALQAAAVALLLHWDAREVGPVFALPGLLILVATVLFSGFGASLDAPANLLVFALWSGAIAGRAALVLPDALKGWTAIRQPGWLPAPTLGVLLLAGGFRSCFIAWQAEGIRPILRAASPPVVDPMNSDSVNNAISLLQTTPHEGNAVAHWQLGERLISRFRLASSKELEERLKMPWRQAWEGAGPEWLAAQIHLERRANSTRSLDVYRANSLFQDNLFPADRALRSALAATPALPEVAVRLAELAFLHGDPTANKAFGELAETLAPNDAEILFRVGLQDFFAERLDRAVGAWNRSLAIKPVHMIEVFNLAAAHPKLGLSGTFTKVVPRTPEALLTFAEEKLAGPNHAVQRITAVEQAADAIGASNLAPAEKSFQTARIHRLNNEWPQALASFRAAVDARPESVRYRHTLALALQQSGDREGALNQLRECVKLAPDEAEFRRYVEELEKPTTSARGSKNASSESSGSSKSAPRQ
jgi:tetratricopeptide (TPR) repeat protein